MCLATSNNLLLVLQDAPKGFFSTKPRSSGQPKNDAMTLFFPTLHPLSPVIFATATVVAFVLLRSYMFSFYCYTQREATPTQKSARKWCFDLSRLFARKMTKGIHSCKPVHWTAQYPLCMCNYFVPEFIRICIYTDECPSWLSLLHSDFRGTLFRETSILFQWKLEEEGKKA